MAVVSWRCWQAQFNGEARALGAIIDITDRRLPGPVHATVVGVAEPEFSGMTASMRQDVGVPWRDPTAMRSRAGVALLARLKPGASIAQARAEMRVLDQSRIDGVGAARSAVATRGDRRDVGARDFRLRSPTSSVDRCRC